MDGLPHSPTNCAFNVREHGALGDGRTLETPALQAAIEACARCGGGTVYFPAGVYRTGSLFLRSHITLYLDAGATLLGSENPQDYPIIVSRWEGAEQLSHAPLIAGEHLHTIALVGRGTIDGQGGVWWQRHWEQTLTYPRPRLIAFSHCTNILIEGLTLLNSPSWTIHPAHCENIAIDKVTILNPPDSPNTDGIDPDSCRDVRIANCYISVGDDCIAIKAGTEHEAADKRAPCQNIAITNCTMAAGHGGVVFGSEMSGGIRNVVVSNCIFIGTDRGIRLKSRRGRGGVVEDIHVTNVVMNDLLCPFTINLYYACGVWGDETVAAKCPQPVTAGTPVFRRIHLSHITAHNVKYAAGFLYGLAEMPIEDVSLSDVSISMAANAEPGYPEMADHMELMQRAGFFACNVQGLRLHNVEVRGQSGPALRMEASAAVEISASAALTPDSDAPAIQLRDVAGAFVHGCRASEETDIFLQVEGAASRGIVLSGNHLTCAAHPLVLAAEVSPTAVVTNDEVPTSRERP